MKNSKQIIGHVLFWIIIMISFAVSEWGYRESLADALIFELLFLPSRLIAVYVNWFLLIPRYLYANKLLSYFVRLLLLLVVLGIAHRYFVLYWGYPMYFPKWVSTPLQPLNIPRVVQTILIIVSPVAFTTGFKLFMNWYSSKKEAELLKQEKKEAELKFLRSQTNPHFLFNSLNSIYGLALDKSNKTPELILKLSNILSYTLYESNTELVELKKEIELIENIVHLEKERFGKRVDIYFTKEGNFEEHFLPPILLIPLVENAFKHGVKNELHKGKIYIHVSMEGDRLFFSIENTVPEKTEEPKIGGLGLTNVSRRLDLIYGDQKDLVITEKEKTFKVELTINKLSNES